MVVIKQINQKGFTLVELMTVMAIIGILAVTIIVSLQNYKERSQVDKLLAEMSAAVEKAYLCWADDGKVNLPGTNGGNDICGLSSEYGQWPQIDSSAFSVINSSSSSINSWHIKLTPTKSDGEQICCSSKNNRCVKQQKGSTCQ